MKIISTVINVSLILSFGKGNKYVITRFPELNVLFFELHSLEMTFHNVFEDMSKEVKKEFCKDVFSSRIFMNDNDNEIFEISVIIQPSIAKVINNAKPRVEARDIVCYNNIPAGRKIFLRCYTTKENIELYISDDGITERKRYFVFFKYLSSPNMRILGFVEPTSNFRSNTFGGLDSFYLNQKRKRTEAEIEKKINFFNKLYEDEALRLCSVVFESVQPKSDNPLKSYIVEATDITYKNDDTPSQQLELHTENIVRHKIPLMECAVRQYPSGYNLPPFIFHITPSFGKLADVFLLEGINYNTYKLKKHLIEVSPIIKENRQFRKSKISRSLSGFWLIKKNN